MFKNLARIDAFRPHGVPEKTAPAYCNDNRPGRALAAASKRAGRLRPRCHWRAVGGRLECYWQIESADETSAEAPGLSCTRNMPWRRVDRLLRFATPGKLPIRVATA
jgi:hypothetical protein